MIDLFIEVIKRENSKLREFIITLSWWQYVKQLSSHRTHSTTYLNSGAHKKSTSQQKC